MTRSQDNTPQVKGVRRQGVNSRSFTVGSSGPKTTSGTEPMMKDGKFNDTGARQLAALQKQMGACLDCVVKAIQKAEPKAAVVKPKLPKGQKPNATDPRILKMPGDLVLSVTFRSKKTHSRIDVATLGENQGPNHVSQIVEDLDRFPKQESLHGIFAGNVLGMAKEYKPTDHKAPNQKQRRAKAEAEKG